MKKHILAIAITSAAVLQANAASNIGYLSGENQEPWGVTSNVDAMNAAFGAGNWDRHGFLSFNTASLANMDLLYIDGGDGTAGEFNAFIAANYATLESWVADGNCLLINAARWEGGEDYWGFNTWALFDSSYAAASFEGWATGPHPIFDGSTGTAWTGGYFSHDVIFDSPFTSLIEGTSGPVLVEGDWGSGHVMIGGMTSSYFHQPQAEAFNLRVNMLEYLGEECDLVIEQPVPEVQHYAAMLGAVMAGAEMMRRRRKA